jgi:2,4-dienoyl-CoA reductase-like NADH-dependent reductase (Old Yellow Enzyme family)
MDDGVPGGLRLEESLQIARWLEADGALDALQLTVGSSLFNPMYYFHGDAPRREFARAIPPPLRWAFQAGAARFLREYPYRDAYLLDLARQFRNELSMPLMLLGGITSKQTMDRAMREGFDFVAMARALLRQPDLVSRIQNDAAARSLCTHCNACMPTIFTRTRCVLTAPEGLPTHRRPVKTSSPRPAAPTGQAGHRSFASGRDPENDQRQD